MPPTRGFSVSLSAQETDTPGFRFPLSNPGEKVSAENVRRAARAVLIAAQAGKHQVVAIPGMGASGGVPPKEAARAIVEEIRAHKNKPFPETIYLVDLDEEMVAAFEYALENAQQSL